MKTVGINSATTLKGYSLRIQFSDNTEQIVDFEPFLKSSLNPEIQRFLNKRRFKQFRIENGDLIWGDYEMLFPIMDLYRNSIGTPKKIRPKSAS